MDKTELRIFLGAPSADTGDARQAVAEIVARLAADPVYARRLNFVLCRWDDPAAPVAMSAARDPQWSVNERKARPRDCTLVIALFRHTMGGVMPEAAYGRSGSGRAWHCTEWEVADGLAGVANGEVDDVWVFRDLTPPAIDLGQPTAEQRRRSDEALEVSVYFDSFRNPDGSWRRGFNPYSGALDLAQRLDPMLRGWAAQFIPAAIEKPPSGPETLYPGQRALLAAVLAAGDKPVDRATLREALDDPVTGLRGHLLARYAKWACGAGGQLDRRFVNLTLMLDRGLEADAERFAPDMRKGDQGRYDDLGELLADNADVTAWVLVGDPGAGKTTLLQHHELVTARAALRALGSLGAGDRGGDAGLWQRLRHAWAGTRNRGAATRPEFCIWQRLADYTSDSPPPAEWLAARWVEQNPALPTLAELQRDVRPRFLLDGLNEIRAPDRRTQAEAAARWATWATQQAGRALAPIFSVRTLEQMPLGAGGAEVRQIALGRWTEAQMREYCAATLGEGNALWQAIDAERELRELSALPFNLAAQCELYAHLHHPARDHAELLSGLTWLLLRRPNNQPRLKAPGLLADEDWQQLAGERWKRSLLALPVQGCLVRWLEAVAQRLHRQGRQVGIRRAELHAELNALHAAELRHQPEAAQPAAWLHAVQGLGLVGEGEIDPLSGRASLRFNHQLWQEFLAGRALRALPDRPAAEWPDLAPPALSPLDKVLAELGRQEPLPGPPVSHWEEAVKLAVQLAPEPLRWLRALLAVNPALAGRAALRVRQRVDDQGFWSELRQCLLTRSRDAALDLRQRIEAAEALGPLGDPRYLEGRGPKGQRYLLPRREYWVRVPAGSYPIGSDASTEDDEKPATRVELALFEIAFAPVTNAEFACFLDAGGYEEKQWWIGETAQRWWRGELRNEDEIRYWRELYADLRKGGEAAIRRRIRNLTEASLEILRERAGWSAEYTETQLEYWYGGKKKHRAPEFWDNPRFNTPLQPVVGVSVFEAHAYCAWLNAQCGQAISLPTEAQWEAAARGAEGRRWPWGDADPERWQINADPAHLRRTSPVGVFPGADAPNGATDLAGNVWQWTSSPYAARIDATTMTEPAGESAARRAVRGGSWISLTELCRAGCRNPYSPGDRDNLLGFRVVCCPILEP